MLKTFLCRLTKQILTKNYFTLYNKIYHQIQGTAMRSRMAPSYANNFMHYLEAKILDSIILKPNLWLWFINDIYMIWSHGPNELHHLMTTMNHFYQIIKFIISFNCNEIAFLDTRVIRDTTSSIYTKVYHKQTDSKNNWWILWNRTLVVEDKLSSIRQLDFIRSEGELKCCTLYGF